MNVGRGSWMVKMERLHLSMRHAMVSAMNPLHTFQVAMPWVRSGSWRISNIERFPVSSISCRIA